jgi:simple sugar transport system substrate-binding protein
MSKKLLSLITLLAIVGLLVAGCGATPEPQVVKETVVVTEMEEVTVVETVEVETEVTVVETVEVEKEVTVVETVEVEKEVEVPVVVDPRRELDIYMVQHALCAWDSWWCTMKDAVETAEEALGVNVTVLGPDEFDLEKTAALIDQAVAAQPDGIAVTVSDPVLFREPIMRAIEAGIPVVGFNAGSGPEADGIPYLTYIGADEYQGGYQGGKRLAAAGGTKAVCVNHQVGHTGLDARCQGLTDAFTEAGLEVEVLAVTNDPAESQTIIDDYFTANPDTDTFLTLGPNSANPFYAFMEAAGLGAGDVYHGTFDLDAEIVAKIKDGTTLFGIDQQPYLQGYGSILTLTLLNRYGISPALPVTATGPGFVDTSNITIVEALAGTYR